MQFSGVYAVLPTPFRAGGEIDTESLKRLVDLYVAAGVQGVTALGVTSEVARMSDRERHVVVEVVTAHVAGRAQVVVGTTADGLRTCIEFSRQAQALGASAAIVSPPRAPRVSTESVVNHYRLLAEAVDLPIIVQDYPPRSGFVMESGVLARVAREVPAARTIMLEDPPTPFKTTRILAAARETKLTVLGGLGGVYLLEELMAGASGVMTAFTHPEALVHIVTAFRDGLVDDAADLFYRVLPLIRFECQEGIGIAIRKELLRRRGALSDASVRAPGPVLDESTRAALDRVLAWSAGQEGLSWISG